MRAFSVPLEREAAGDRASRARASGFMRRLTFSAHGSKAELLLVPKSTAVMFLTAVSGSCVEIKLSVYSASAIRSRIAVAVYGLTGVPERTQHHYQIVKTAATAVMFLTAASGWCAQSAENSLVRDCGQPRRPVSASPLPDRKRAPFCARFAHSFNDPMTTQPLAYDAFPSGPLRSHLHR